ncbi:MAG: hypothetical protein ABW123_27115 [Cystobacter sp.]
MQALPDAGNETSSGPPLFHVVAAPRVVRALDGQAPLFSLTLLLSRPPRPGEDSILALVTGGVCAMTLSVLPSVEELARAEDASRALQPLFPRRTTWTLRRAEAPEPLAGFTSEGASGRGALSLSLDREDALAVLASVRGEDTSIRLECELAFRAVTAALPPLRVTVELLQAHNALAERAGGAPRLSEHEVLDVLAALIGEDAIQVMGAGALAPDALARALLEDLLRALMPVLQRVADAPEGAGRMFALRPRPLAPSTLTFQRAAGPAAVDRSLWLVHPLSRALEGLMGGYGLDAFVRLVCPASDGTLQPVPRRLPTARAVPGASRPDSPLASVGTTTAALSAVLKTNARASVSAQALLSSDLVIRSQPGRLNQAWALDDLILDRPSALGILPLRHLPVMGGNTSGPWVDRIDPGLRWYAPELGVVEPSPTAPSSTSPFLFSFRTVGHDAQGNPGLEATVRFTLRARRQGEGGEAVRVQARLEPVPLGGLSASLEIPFRDPQGKTRTQAVTATDISRVDEDVVVTFQLTDQWARLCYGALSVAGFQQQPVRLVTSYTFAAYVPIRREDSRVLWGGKTALTPIGQAPASREGSDLRRPATVVLNHATALSPLMASTAAVQPAAQLAVHAPLVGAASAAFFPIQRLLYGIRSQGHTDRQDVLMPCNQWGALYVQATEAGEVAMGCRDAFTVGQALPRLYERLDVDLGSRPGLKVYRSLQVPGRFLVVPDVYTIARFEPGDSRGYRPAIYLFSSVDAVHPEQGSCILMATLQPGVPAFRREQLLELLRRQFHPHPSLEWPTELDTTPVYDWALSGANPIQPGVAKTPEGFQVSLSTPLVSALQLKSIVEHAGVGASVRFPLSDGSRVESTLAVDLSLIEGPFVAGPIDAKRAGGAVTLVNRVEQALDVSDVVLYTAGLETGQVAVEQRLAAGQSLSLDGVPAADVLVPRYTRTGEASSLDEVRTFIEDIYTNVVFMSGVDFAGQGLAELTVEAGVIGVPGTRAVHLSAGTLVDELRFLLPLTVYLAQPTLRFRVSARATGGAITTGPWRDWRLDTLGNVISITANLFQGG